WCIVAATSITVSATLRAHGTRPLVLAATESVTVGGAIDVDGRDLGAPNANAACTKGTAPAMKGGGYGGSHGSLGAPGGYGNNMPAAAGGIPAAVTNAAAFAGGCDGGTGGGSGGMIVLAAPTIGGGGAIEANGGGGGAGSEGNSDGGDGLAPATRCSVGRKRACERVEVLGGLAPDAERSETYLG